MRASPARCGSLPRAGRKGLLRQRRDHWKSTNFFPFGNGIAHGFSGWQRLGRNSIQQHYLFVSAGFMAGIPTVGFWNLRQKFAFGHDFVLMGMNRLLQFVQWHYRAEFAENLAEPFMVGSPINHATGHWRTLAAIVSIYQKLEPGIS